MITAPPVQPLPAELEDITLGTSNWLPAIGIPEYARDTDLKMAEGFEAHLLEVRDGEVQLLDVYRLERFEVARGAARWEFKSSTGQIVEGNNASVALAPRVSVKLVMPIVLRPCNNGLRVTFRFRVDTGFAVVSRGMFRRMIEGGAQCL